MPSWWEFLSYTLTARERRQQKEAAHRDRLRRKKLFEQWYAYYRTLGLGEWRARRHAERRSKQSKRPPEV